MDPDPKQCYNDYTFEISKYPQIFKMILLQHKKT